MQVMKRKPGTAVRVADGNTGNEEAVLKLVGGHGAAKGEG